MADERIYHLATAAEFRDGTSDGSYTPAGFDRDGFVHCTAGRDTVLAVARDYYADLREVLWLIELDPDRLESPCVFEAPAPVAGTGTDHLATATLFPHVYGPLNLSAITGVARMGDGDRRFTWPDGFEPLDALRAS